MVIIRTRIAVGGWWWHPGNRGVRSGAFAEKHSSMKYVRHAKQKFRPGFRSPHGRLVRPFPIFIPDFLIWHSAVGWRKFENNCTVGERRLRIAANDWSMKSGFYYSGFRYILKFDDTLNFLIVWSKVHGRSYELNVKIQVNIDRYKLDGYKYKCKEYRKVA